MKIKLLTVILSILLFASCNIVKVGVNGASPSEPTVQVGSQRNHHFIGGLVRGGKTKLKAQDYVSNTDKYVVKTKTTFINGLVGFFSLWIYTPTTTSFLIPLSEYNDNYSDQGENTKIKEGEEIDIYNDLDGQPVAEIEIAEVKAIKAKKPNRIEKKNKKSDTSFDFLDSEEDKGQDRDNKNGEENIFIIKEASVATPNPKPNPKPVEKNSPALENITKTSVKKESIDSKPTKPMSTPAVANESSLKSDYKGIVYFKSGARMNGIVTEYSSGKVVIKLPGGSTKECNIKDIQKIDPQ